MTSQSPAASFLVGETSSIARRERREADGSMYLEAWRKDAKVAQSEDEGIITQLRPSIGS